MLDQIIKGTKKGDALYYYKKFRSNYDVIVANTLIRPKL